MELKTKNQNTPSRNSPNTEVNRKQGVIVLFSPEHFYLFNTNAVPLLTGYLTEKGYPVVQRVLDNEFYSYVAHPETLQKSFAYLMQHACDLPQDQLDYLEETIERGKLKELLNIEANDSRSILSKLQEHREKVVRLLHKAEQLLSHDFLRLSKERFLLAMAHLQCAVDLYTTAFWPSKFSLIAGASFPYASEKSKSVYRALSDSGSNFLLPYYQQTIVPSIPFDTSIVGISLTHESQIIPAFTLAREIKTQMPNVHIAMGGATLSSLRETFEKSNILWEYLDSVVIGAGEEPLARLYDEITSDTGDLDLVPNLVWQDRHGKIRKASATGTFAIDQVATPVFNDPRPKPILTLMTSIGCDWAKCKFCHFPRIYSEDTSYQTRPVAHVMRDIEILTERHHPAYFHICDTNLATSRLEELADMILQSPSKPQFYSFVRAEKRFTDIDFCKKVRQAGFFALHFGVESGSQRILDSLNKGITLGTVSQVIQNLSASDIMVNVFLIAGAPGEKQDDFERSIRFVKEHLHHIAGEVAVSRYYMDKHSYICYHPSEFGLSIEHDPTADLDTDVNFWNAEGFNPTEMDSLVEDFYENLGIPVSYGERYFFEMLERFCPNSLWQKTLLYSPFVWAGVQKGLKTVLRRKKVDDMIFPFRASN